MVDLQLETIVISTMICQSDLCETGIDELELDCFNVEEFRKAFLTIIEIWGKNGKVDLVSFFKKYEPNDLISITKITELSFVLFGEDQFVNAVNRLKELRDCRNIARASEKLMNLAKQGNLEEAIKMGTETFLDDSKNNDSLKVVTPSERAEDMKKLVFGKKKRTAIYTQFPSLNNMMSGGLAKGDLLIVAAPTGHGKTNLALNLSCELAVNQKNSVLYINTEMSEEQINARMITILSDVKGITYSKIIEEKLGGAGERIASNSFEAIKNSSFFGVEARALDIKKAEVLLRRQKRKNNIRVAILDYVGRMDTISSNKPTHEVLVHISKRLKTIAQELGITIIMLAQLNDNFDLQGAKAMRNEATVYITMDRPKEVDAQMEGRKTESINGKDKKRTIADRILFYESKGANGALFVEKNRIGREGRIFITFDQDTLKIREVEKNNYENQRKS